MTLVIIGGFETPCMQSANKRVCWFAIVSETHHCIALTVTIIDTEHADSL